MQGFQHTIQTNSLNRLLLLESSHVCFKLMYHRSCFIFMLTQLWMSSWHAWRSYAIIIWYFYCGRALTVITLTVTSYMVDHTLKDLCYPQTVETILIEIHLLMLITKPCSALGNCSIIPFFLQNIASEQRGQLVCYTAFSVPVALWWMAQQCHSRHCVPVMLTVRRVDPQQSWGWTLSWAVAQIMQRVNANSWKASHTWPLQGAHLARCTLSEYRYDRTSSTCTYIFTCDKWFGSSYILHKGL